MLILISGILVLTLILSIVDPEEWIILHFYLMGDSIKGRVKKFLINRLLDWGVPLENDVGKTC